jgi:ADP-ribose pyrophosphatase
MKLNKWELLQQGAKMDLKLFQASLDTYINPRNLSTNEIIRLESNDSANVIALNQKGCICLVRQFRFGISDFTLELPGGVVDIGESPDDAVKRELKEETGYEALEWVCLGKVPSNPVFINSYVHHFLARDLKDTGAQSLDLGEDLELGWYEQAEVFEMIRSGMISNPHTLSAFLLLVMSNDIVDKLFAEQLVKSF